MAMRRPRIKAAANITSKRKPKPQSIDTIAKAVVNEKLNNDEQLNKSDSDTVKKDENIEEHFKKDVIYKQENSQRNNSLKINENISGKIAADELSSNLEASFENPTEENDVFIGKTEKDNNSFKCPAKVDNSRTLLNQSATSSNDDVFQTDFEENVIQMDLHKSASGFPMSPSKTQARQRIRATPVFQRRNSLMGSTLSAPSTPQAEDTPAPIEFAIPTHRRERHYSASISQPSLNAASTTYHHAPQKFIPTAGLGRTRTESGCSAFSDSYATPSKLRKTDDHNQRPRSQRDYDARFTRGVPDKSTLKMFELIYYNPVTNPMEQKPNISQIKKEASSITENRKDSSSNEVKLTTEKCNEDGTPNALPVPQLKLNSNGELILDDKSLEIETTAEQEARKVLANSSLIFLDENTGMNGFYKRQKRTKEWPPEETVKFYRCLQTIGTDFSLMCQLFPKRTRRDLKLKFKKEERCNGTLINKALLYPKTFNVEDLKKQLETEERERAEVERQWKEIKAKEAKAVKKINVTTSVAARVLKHGDDIYENENIIKRKISKRSQSKNKALAKEAEAIDINNGINQNDKANKPKKQKRTRKIKKMNATENVECIENHASKISIKTEKIKSEHVSVMNDSSSSLYVNSEPTNATNSNELENEISELLQPDNLQEQEEFISYNKHTENSSDPFTNYDENNTTISKSLVNLDDGTLNPVNEDSDIICSTTTTAIDLPSSSATNEISTEHGLDDLDELDIQQILTELAEGSLVLVSTLDPDNADKVVNEIYMLDKNSGELCEKPLDIPETIVQAILSVMS